MNVREINVQAITSLMATELNKLTLNAIERKPYSKVLNLEDVNVETIKSFLRTKGSQEWARRSISSDEAMEATAEWFKGELDKLYSFVCLQTL